uniref:Uncharacterized protein n=1 Tax=Oryza punctata TaxID=4537 RepID=A0A0E0LEZ7_ORYPU
MQYLYTMYKNEEYWKQEDGGGAYMGQRRGGRQIAPRQLTPVAAAASPGAPMRPVPLNDTTASHSVRQDNSSVRTPQLPSTPIFNLTSPSLHLGERPHKEGFQIRQQSQQETTLSIP